MSDEIKNVKSSTIIIAKNIGELANTIVSKANGTSEVSNDGLTAEYSDKILDMLDIDIKTIFEKIMTSSNEKFCDIAEDFESADIEASM